MILCLVLPAGGALLFWALGRRPNLRDGAALLVSSGLFAMVARLVPRVESGERPALRLMEMFPGGDIAFRVEPLGLLFALVASGLWVATSAYSIGYMRAQEESNQTRFVVFFALAITAAIGVAFAANLVTLFVFYEALTLSTFPLVTHAGTEEAKRAGRVYLGILLSTSIGLLLLAIVWTSLLAGTLDFREGGILEGRAGSVTLGVLLGLYAFGTGKAALMPFHRWLPAAMVAPTPVSALLHAVAVVKAGVFTILKVAVYVFGLDLLAETRISVWLMYAAGGTAILASLVALAKDDLKARLAYSTIAHLSYIVLGAALADPAGILGGGLHLVMHAFGKITLFFCAGAILVAHHKKKVSELDGIGRVMPITMTAFLLGSLSIIGIPPFGGAWSKWILLWGTAGTGHAAVVLFLLVGSLLNVGYLIPIVVRAFFRPAPGGMKEAPAFCVVPLCVTAVGGFLLFFFSDPLYRFLLPVTGR